jgi:PAS domain S-box-containing protein
MPSQARSPGRGRASDAAERMIPRRASARASEKESALDRPAVAGAADRPREDDPIAAIEAVTGAIGDGLVVVDGVHGIRSIDPQAARLLGVRDRQRAVGTALDAALDGARPRDRAGVAMTGAEVRRRSSKEHDLRVSLRAGRLRPGGSNELRWVVVTSTAVGDDTTATVLRDVTDTVALEETARRLEATADGAFDAVYLAQPGSFRLTYANDRAIEQSGWTAEGLAERTLLDLLPRLDVGRLRREAEHNGEGAAFWATVLRRRDGELRPVDLALRRVEPAVGHPAVLAVVRDVSERVESHARLQRLVQQERARAAELETVLSAIGDAVVVCATDGVVTLANPASVDMFGSRPPFTFGELAERFEDPEGRFPKLSAVVDQGPVELHETGPSGRWIELSAFPVLGPPQVEDDSAEAQGPVSATIFLARDVTEARETRRMREAFVGVLSHELRTPVTTILGGTKVLRRRGRLSADTRDELYADIEAESERLYRLVEDLLVLARFEERLPESVSDEPLLLQRLLPGLVESEGARWPGHRIALHVPTGLTTVRGDPTYVEQVVRNLLGNACKYSPIGGTVDIRVEPTLDEVQVRILDDGPAFPASEAVRLFELFYRSPSTVDIAGGAGIGLFVCRRLVEAMGGRVWAYPRPEGGAEFGFALRSFNEEEA